MHAMALEYLGGSNSLFPLSGKRVLDIGSGSGYLTACLAELVFPSAPLPNQEKEGEEGMVVGIDHITGLRDMALRNFPKRERGRRCLESGKVKFVVGDGRRGWVGDGLVSLDFFASFLHDHFSISISTCGFAFPVHCSYGIRAHSVQTG